MEECFHYYFPHIVVFNILLYDLRNYQIKYFYFFIFIFFIINVYRRFRKFISQLDFYEIDKIVANYFYKTDIHNQMMQAENHSQRLKLFGDNEYAFNLHNYYGQKHYGDKFKKYFERGFVVDYVDINLKKSYEPYNIRMLYIGIFISYIIFCYNMSIIYCIIISIPLFIGIILYEYCFYTYKTQKKYIMSYMILYILLFIIAIGILIWIYLTRHTFYFINDYIWNYKFTIKQYFTIDEKLIFLKEYFIFKIRYFSLHEKLELLKILKSISYYDLLQSSTIIEIKEYVDNLIQLYEKLENNIYPSLKDCIRKNNRYKPVNSKLDIIMKYIKITIKIMIYNKRKIK